MGLALNQFPALKEFIIPTGDGYLVEVDLSQLEVMALAELCDDENLIKDLNNGVDIHRQNAAMWKRCDPDSVSDSDRKAAKRITFQTFYGASPKSIARTTGLELEEVDDFLSGVYTKYPKLKEYYDKLFEAGKQGHEMKPINRLNILDSIGLTSPTQRSYYADFFPSKFDSKYRPSPTQMKNYPVQGFATGDLIPFVGLLIEEEIEQYLDAGCSEYNTVLLVNTVHDSYVYDIPKAMLYPLLNCVELAFEKLKEEFNKLFDYELKLDYTYGVEVGESWNGGDEFSRKEVQDVLNK